MTTSGSIPHIHDALWQAQLLRSALQSDKVRVGYFIGAGCPLGIYDENGESSLKLIPDVNGLTIKVRQRILETDPIRYPEEPLIPCWDKLNQSCKEGGIESPNVEDLLSELRTLSSRRGTSDIDGISKKTLQALDNEICSHIAAEVGKPLPTHRCSYNRLASWVGGLQRVAPVELFTTNYDLLLEEALEQQRVPHFDGFVGSHEPFFDLSSIEEDVIPQRWTRLWKLHGSINWQRREDGTVFRVSNKAAVGKAMIYPSHLKYDQSRRMPYLAMLDRLRAFFRGGRNNMGFGPPVLVVCGYSFSDIHLNEVLLEGLASNQAAQCFALAYTPLADSQKAIELAVRYPNLTVIALDGAVVGTKIGKYQFWPSPASSNEPWLRTDLISSGADTQPQYLPSSLLGDFHFFGLLLQQLYGGQEEERHVSH